MISASVHQRARAGDGGGGDFDALGFVADGGGVGEDTGRRRGVSGISRGRSVLYSICMLIEREPCELCGGVTGALNVWLGREMRGLKAHELKVPNCEGPSWESKSGVFARSKSCKCPATAVLGLPPHFCSCPTEGRVGRLANLRREGKGASVISESSTPLFRFGDMELMPGQLGSCISVVELSGGRDWSSDRW